LAPDYLFWPLIFILATGRLRIASVYAVISSFVFFLYYLVPGASFQPGVELGALLPLRSLRFLGLPVAARRWFSSPVALDVWHPLANLIVPLAMCALGVYLLVSRYQDRSASQPTAVEPLELRSIRTIMPYAALMVLVVIGYGVVSIDDPNALVTSIYRGVNRYSFAHPIYSWRHWATFYFWMVNHPLRDILGGSWWGTFLILGPLSIGVWGIFAVRASRRNAPGRRADEPS
jgi:hypothetical protein